MDFAHPASAAERWRRPREHPIDTREFQAMFGDGVVRVLLNWQRLREPEFCVRQSFSRSVEHLGNLFTVWYSGADGRAVDWSEEGARPMRVREAAANERSWSTRRAGQLADLEERFRREELPVQLVLPAYAVGGDDLVIIDGTHRSVAAYRADVPVRLMLVGLHGPLDADVLPDLRHHLGA
ncbi:hypothetical protein [Actinosynnema sp. NPDC023587]|uniref:hypothetical protein n=1 Tax=Actinosynnema sp. NPDC023587 TaxID=3154695 RepID=UPI0033F0DEA0